MEIIRRVFKQTIWQLLGKGITSLSTIIVLGMVSRNYGEYGTGVLTLALTYIAFFVIAVDFGVNAHVLPKMLQKDFTLEWRRLLGFRLNLAAFLTIVGLFVVLVLPDQDVLFKQLVLIGLIFAVFEGGVFVSGNAIFQSKLKYDHSTLAWGVGSLVTLLSVSAIIFYWQNLGLVMFGYVVGWLTTLLLSLLLVRKIVKNLWPIFDGEYAVKLVRESWPISLTLLLNVVYFRVDAFLLTFFKGFSDVGVYNLSYQVFQSALVLPTFIMNGYYPIMLSQLSGDRGLFRITLLKASGIMFVIALAGTVLTFILSPFVIRLLTGGHGFSGAVEVLNILSLGYPAYFISALLMWTMVTLKKYKIMFGIYLLGLLINVLLNLIFIPVFSFQASAYITGITEYLILVLQLVILVPVLRNKFKS